LPGPWPVAEKRPECVRGSNAGRAPVDQHLSGWPGRRRPCGRKTERQITRSAPALRLRFAGGRAGDAPCPGRAGVRFRGRMV
jgi:hypothetical protein